MRYRNAPQLNYKITQISRTEVLFCAGCECIFCELSVSAFSGAYQVGLLLPRDSVAAVK